MSTVLIACFSPSCASEMTRRTPFSPRFTRLRKKRRPERPILRRADVDAQHLPLALAGDADGDDGGLADDAPVDADLVVRRIDPEVRDARP